MHTLRTEPRGPPSSGIVRSKPMLPSEYSICHTNLGTTIYILVCFISWSGHRLMPVIMRIMRRSGPGLTWTPCILLMTPKEYPLHRFSTFHYFLFKCIRVPRMCPEPRLIDYPAPRSPADSFVMAGPIKHCLLRAWLQSNIIRLSPPLLVSRLSSQSPN